MFGGTSRFRISSRGVHHRGAAPPQPDARRAKNAPPPLNLNRIQELKATTIAGRRPLQVRSGHLPVWRLTAPVVSPGAWRRVPAPSAPSPRNSPDAGRERGHREGIRRRLRLARDNDAQTDEHAGRARDDRTATTRPRFGASHPKCSHRRRGTA